MLKFQQHTFILLSCLVGLLVSCSSDKGDGGPSPKPAPQTVGVWLTKEDYQRFTQNHVPGTCAGFEVENNSNGVRTAAGTFFNVKESGEVISALEDMSAAGPEWLTLGSINSAGGITISEEAQQASLVEAKKELADDGVDVSAVNLIMSILVPAGASEGQMSATIVLTANGVTRPFPVEPVKIVKVPEAFQTDFINAAIDCLN